MVVRPTGRRPVRTRIGYAFSGLAGLGITAIGVRFLVAPGTAAAGYGLAEDVGDPPGNPYLAVKGVRDIASGVVTFLVMTAGSPQLLGRYMLAASVIPIGDATIVLRHDGPRATAYGVHGSTAAVMLITAALLLVDPE